MGRRGRSPGEFPVLLRALRVDDELHGLNNVGIVQLFGFGGKYRRSLSRISREG